MSKKSVNFGDKKFKKGNFTKTEKQFRYII